MTYEPKVGDEVVVRGEVTRLQPTSTGLWTTVRMHPARANWSFPADMLEPAPDLGEAELRGQVTGPWAVALSEAMDKIEKRVEALKAAPPEPFRLDLVAQLKKDREIMVGAMAHLEKVSGIGARIEALEASAKVRDVPATMVNLAHRVQSLEVTNKTLMDTMREREDATRAELDGVLLRVGKLEFARANTEDPVNVKWTADTGQFMWLPRGRNPNIEPDYKKYTWTSAPNKPLGHKAPWADAEDVRDAQGRVLKSKTRDVDPQGDWSTARVADNVVPSIDRQALETARRDNAELREQLGAAQKATLQIRAANHRLMADIQRAEARLDRISTYVREPGVGRDRLEEILQDPAHGDPPLSDPPADGDRPRTLGDAK